MNSVKKVVFVDNDLDDVDIMKSVFKSMEKEAFLQTFNDSEEALQFLSTDAQKWKGHLFFAAGHEHAQAFKKRSCFGIKGRAFKAFAHYLLLYLSKPTRLSLCREHWCAVRC